jgi:hypothetical protein
MSGEISFYGAQIFIQPELIKRVKQIPPEHPHNISPIQIGALLSQSVKRCSL